MKFKVGDKIYCIKTIESTRFDNTYKHSEVKELSREDAVIYLKSKVEKYIEFRTGDQYTILSMQPMSTGLTPNGIEVKLKGKNNIVRKDIEFIEENFLYLKEFRKIKLDELSDTNFVSFLKKIKK